MSTSDSRFAASTKMRRHAPGSGHDSGHRTLARAGGAVGSNYGGTMSMDRGVHGHFALGGTADRTTGLGSGLMGSNLSEAARQHMQGTFGGTSRHDTDSFGASTAARINRGRASRKAQQQPASPYGVPQGVYGGSHQSGHATKAAGGRTHAMNRPVSRSALGLAGGGSAVIGGAQGYQLGNTSKAISKSHDALQVPVSSRGFISPGRKGSTPDIGTSGGGPASGRTVGGADSSHSAGHSGTAPLIYTMRNGSNCFNIFQPPGGPPMKAPGSHGYFHQHGPQSRHEYLSWNPNGDEERLVVPVGANGLAHSVPFITSLGGFSAKGHTPGKVKFNQDCMLLAEDPVTKSLLFGIFDGHGLQGHHVSRYFRDNYAQRLFADPRFKLSPAEAMADVVQEVELAMLQTGHIDASLSGSTVVVVVVRGTQIHTACCGDSRAVIGCSNRKGKLQPLVLTVDHKPGAPKERQRILAAGGRVLTSRRNGQPIGPLRVWLADVPAPGLAMSRSVGDMLAKTAGVISTPHRATRQLAGNHRLLIVATDGLWDFTPNQEVLDMATGPEEASAIAETLVRHARKRWLENTGGADDTTVLVAKMQI